MVLPDTGISDLRYLKGIGPKRAQALAKLGVHSIHELLYFFPRRYEDRSRFCRVSEAEAGQSATFLTEILTVKYKPIRRMPIVEILAGDSSGAIPVVWFNKPYLKNQFSQGQKVILFGKVESYKERLQITSPEYELVEDEADAELNTHVGRITPIYPLTEGLFQRSLRQAMKDALETQLYRHIQEYLPPGFRQEQGLIELPAAVQEMHFPASAEQQEKARIRLVFDEFFIFQLILFKKLERIKTKYRAYSIASSPRDSDSFKKMLPFELTPDQTSTLEQLQTDLHSEIPMNRLLQGDVGSGKTAVAAAALMFCARSGFQGALLAPTEILAEQHYRTLSKIFDPLQISIGLLTSATPDPKRNRLCAELKQGKLQILVGTHAIFQEDIAYSKLALVVIDEQHKFGVHQRNQLLLHHPRPHQLVMTATPIPRTLALTLYGDLQISTLRTMPQGRKPIKTYWITRKKQDVILRHVVEKIWEGDQAYIIFPLIEETEKTDLLAATQEYEKLRQGAFKGISMGLVHGRLNSEERDPIMRAFRSGDIKILVATSVIEVGVDNPNATLMIIENAERFGLSQLHQMRGRIGRGQKPSECFLFGEPQTDEGKRRLRILTKTQDGFQIAEEDLKLRGPGDFWGTRQSGDPVFRLANLVTDYEILERARAAAKRLMSQPERIQSPEWTGLQKHLEKFALRY